LLRTCTCPNTCTHTLARLNMCTCIARTCLVPCAHASMHLLLRACRTRVVRKYTSACIHPFAYEVQRA